MILRHVIMRIIGVIFNFSTYDNIQYWVVFNFVTCDNIPYWGILRFLHLG